MPSQPDICALVQPASQKWLAWRAAKGPYWDHIGWTNFAYLEVGTWRIWDGRWFGMFRFPARQTPHQSSLLWYVSLWIFTFEGRMPTHSEHSSSLSGRCCHCTTSTKIRHSRTYCFLDLCHVASGTIAQMSYPEPRWFLPANLPSHKSEAVSFRLGAYRNSWFILDQLDILQPKLVKTRGQHIFHKWEWSECMWAECNAEEQSLPIGQRKARRRALPVL